MKLLVYLQGTILMHRSGLGRTRDERVRQIARADASVVDWVSYVPIGHAAYKMREWQAQGVGIIYLSPHKAAGDVRLDADVLKSHGFPSGTVAFRWGGESFPQVVERILPDILVENDREGSGGERRMIFPHLRPEIRRKIKCIVVREFEGIDHLPDEISTLLFLPDGSG